MLIKIKNIMNWVIFIGMVILAFLWYPWEIEIDSNTKEATCSNILGYKMNCQ